MRTTCMKCLVVIKSDLLKDSTENCGWGRLLLKSLPAICKVKEDGNKMEEDKQMYKSDFLLYLQISIRECQDHLCSETSTILCSNWQRATDKWKWVVTHFWRDRLDKKNTVKPSMGVTAEIETTQNPNNIVNIVIKMKSSWDELVIRWPCEHWVSNMGLTWV